MDGLVRYAAPSPVWHANDGPVTERRAVDSIARHAVAVRPGSHSDRRYPVHGLDDRRFHRVVAFMASHLENDVDIAKLAAVACLSAFHFARMFRLRTGFPPYRYLSAMRLGHAAQLLATTDRSICDIALACRFSNQTNFTRAFRRYAGLAPGEYRRARGSTFDRLAATTVDCRVTGLPAIAPTPIWRPTATTTLRR